MLRIYCKLFKITLKFTVKFIKSLKSAVNGHTNEDIPYNVHSLFTSIRVKETVGYLFI